MEWNSSRVCWGCIWPTVGSIEECFCWKINSFQFLDSCNAHRCVDFAKPILQLQPNWQDCNILDFFICNPIHLFAQPRFENDKWVFQNPPCPLLHRIRYAKTNRQRTDWEALRNGMSSYTQEGLQGPWFFVCAPCRWWCFANIRNNMIYNTTLETQQGTLLARVAPLVTGDQQNMHGSPSPI